MSRFTGRIVAGCQIRAARSLLDWSRHDLARAAGVHCNAVAYWEQTVAVPTGRREPHACARIRHAFRHAGVEFIGHSKPGVRLAQNDNYCRRPPSRAHVRYGVLPVLSVQVDRPCNTEHRPSPKSARVACGARTRANGACRAKAMANHRCRLHGGLSSGPKSIAGRARIAEAQRKRWAKWRDRAAAAQVSQGPNDAIANAARSEHGRAND